MGPHEHDGPREGAASTKGLSRKNGHPDVTRLTRLVQNGPRPVRPPPWFGVSMEGIRGTGLMDTFRSEREVGQRLTNCVDSLHPREASQQEHDGIDGNRAKVTTPPPLRDCGSLLMESVFPPTEGL